MISPYNVLEKAATSYLKVKGSKFYAFAFPIDHEAHFKDELDKIKNEHPKARHWCWALRLAANSYERSSDDGEPSGTAGSPILNTIKSKELLDTGLIVVRYFGGTLLGVRGLIEAYGGAAQEAIELAGIRIKIPSGTIEVDFPYELMSSFQKVLHGLKASVIDEKFTERCRFTLEAPLANMDEVRNKLGNIYGLRILA